MMAVDARYGSFDRGALPLIADRSRLQRLRAASLPSVRCWRGGLLGRTASGSAWTVVVDGPPLDSFCLLYSYCTLALLPSRPVVLPCPCHFARTLGRAPTASRRPSLFQSSTPLLANSPSLSSPSLFFFFTLPFFILLTRIPGHSFPDPIHCSTATHTIASIAAAPLDRLPRRVHVHSRTDQPHPPTGSSSIT